MSILNLTGDGDFIVLTAMISAVKDAGNSIEKAKLFELLGQNYIKNTEHISNTFNRWIELGLFLETSDKISIREDYYKKLPARTRPGNSKLQLLLLEILMSDINNVDLWTDKNSKNNDFTRCCSYILGSDLFFLSGSKTSGQIIKKSDQDSPDLDDSQLLLQNETRITGIKHWMTSLGILTGSSKPIIDPTIMVRSVTSESLNKGEEVVFDEFLKKLNTKFPIMDGGKFRLETEKRLKSRTTNLLHSNKVSISLSFALRRLESEEIIKFDNKGDAAKFNLLDGDLQPIREVSHLKYTGG